MKTYTHKDITLPLSGWAERLGISRQAMYRRVNNANTPEELQKALSAPMRRGSRTDCRRKREEKVAARIARGSHP